VPNPAGNGLFGRIIAAGQGDRQNGIVFASLSQSGGPADACLASAPGTQLAASDQGSPQALPLTAPLAARAAASVADAADLRIVGPTSSPPNQDVIDRVFARLADGSNEVF
jgi:hypothetical protein